MTHLHFGLIRVELVEWNLMKYLKVEYFMVKSLTEFSFIISTPIQYVLLWPKENEPQSVYPFNFAEKMVNLLFISAQK